MEQISGCEHVVGFPLRASALPPPAAGAFYSTFFFLQCCGGGRDAAPHNSSPGRPACRPFLCLSEGKLHVIVPPSAKTFFHVLGLQHPRFCWMPSLSRLSPLGLPSAGGWAFLKKKRALTGGGAHTPVQALGYPWTRGSVWWRRELSVLSSDRG